MTERPPVRRFKFPKKERLHKKKMIEELFEQGSSTTLYPIQFWHLTASNAKENQVLFSVPKKQIKKAVVRNRIKRRMKEAYRLNKFILENVKQNYVLGYIYLSKKELAFKEINSKLKESLERLKEL